MVRGERRRYAAKSGLIERGDVHRGIREELKKAVAVSTKHGIKKSEMITQNQKKKKREIKEMISKRTK